VASSLKHHWRNLYIQREIDLKLYRQGLRLIHPVQWESWIQRALLILGCAFLGSGVLFFFAFNWAKMSGGMKLAVAEVPIFLTLLVVIRKGISHPSSGVLLFLASFFTGVFLAVFGQVYQTGADSYELFRGWALLIFPFCLMGRFLPLWILFSVLIQMSLILYWIQIIGVYSDMEFSFLHVLILVWNTMTLAFYEYFQKRELTWLIKPWARPLLLVPILICIVVPSGFVLLRDYQLQKEVCARLLLMSSPVLFSLLGYYAFKLRSLLMLSMVFIAVGSVLEMGLIRLMGEVSFSRSLESLLLSIFTLVLVCVLGWILINMQRRFFREKIHG